MEIIICIAVRKNRKINYNDFCISIQYIQFLIVINNLKDIKESKIRSLFIYPVLSNFQQIVFS